MNFQDKSIRCSDCGTTFTFSARDQKFFASKGYNNEPRRCFNCRQTNKQQRCGPNYSWTYYAKKAASIREYLPH